MSNTASYSKSYSAHDIPGRAMGIWAFVLSFFVQVLALILGIIALRRSRRAGVTNDLAAAAVAISSVLIVGAVITTLALLGTGGFK
jgi:Ca2+/H+ antiporter